VLLRSDGTAVACGREEEGQCDLPALEAGVTYVQASAGGRHVVLLRSDGSAVACGSNEDGQCSLPALEEDARYVQVSAGAHHTALVRSDGTAVACGAEEHQRCRLPPLDEDATCVQALAGSRYTVLLQSDGAAVACGLALRAPEDGAIFEQDLAQVAVTDRIVDLRFADLGGGLVRLTCSSMSGEEMHCLTASWADSVGDVRALLALAIFAANARLCVVLPSGRLLEAADAEASLADAAEA